MALVLKREIGIWFRESEKISEQVKKSVEEHIKFLDKNTLMIISEDAEIVGVTLGRNQWNVKTPLKGNLICFDSMQVSANHCRIIKAKGVWYIQDLGSSNGTRIKRTTSGPDGMYRVVLETGWYPLLPGDKIILGAGPKIMGSLSEEGIIKLQVVQCD